MRLVEDFFCGIWEDGGRRKALFWQWLAYTPQGCVDKTPIGYCTYIVNAICVERANLQFGTGGSVQLSASINLHFDWFLTEEKKVLMEMCGEKYFARQKRTDERVTHMDGFFFNHLILKQHHRELLMRDFVSICVAQSASRINLLLPLYALIAVQTILAEHSKISDSVCHGALSDAEYVLMGFSLPQRIPIYSNRRKGASPLGSRRIR